MRICQHVWTEATGWSWGAASADPPGPADQALLLVFGSPTALARPDLLAALTERHPGISRLTSSAAGAICGEHVLDEALVATLLMFDHTRVRGVEVPIESSDRGLEAGRRVAAVLRGPELRHVLVVAEGIDINGSDLVRGLTTGLAPASVSGGLAGDLSRPGRTLVSFDGVPERHRVAAVGLYGEKLVVGCGSLGGWDSFGPQRLVTRSEGNVLYELDGEPALDLYKRFLGDHAKDLPESGLRFPLSLLSDAADSGVVRSLLAVREDDASLVFAGDIPEGSHVRLMKANYDRLVDGAISAAEASLGSGAPEFALLVSCVGRRVVLRQRIEEELEGVQEVLGRGVPSAGFYSYGEIAPFRSDARCELHNQTMTVTTFREAE